MVGKVDDSLVGCQTWARQTMMSSPMTGQVQTMTDGDGARSTTDDDDV